MSSRPWRLFSAVIAVAVLLALGWWLTRARTLASEDLGPARSLLGRHGSPDLLVEREAGRWEWRHVDPLDESERVLEVPVALPGRPALDGRGGVLWVADAALRRFALDGALSDAPLPLEASADVRLVGVDARGVPVLRDPHSDGDRLYVRHGALGWVQLADASDRARVPADARVLLAEARPALAFRGAEGWEAWRFDDPAATRLVARRRFGEQAAFTPDGRALVVDGVVDGLDRLELDEERMRFMGEGNLGTVPGLPFSAVFRGDPPLLVASRRDLQGNLQIHQAHLGGGGGYQFTTGYLHHYLPRVSADGVWLAYAQTEATPQGGDGFPEDLYLFDFSRPANAAVPLGRRTGGFEDQGPLFPGNDRIAWIADGRLRLAALSARQASLP